MEADAIHQRALAHARFDAVEGARHARESRVDAREYRQHVDNFLNWYNHTDAADAAAAAGAQRDAARTGAPEVAAVAAAAQRAAAAAAQAAAAAPAAAAAAAALAALVADSRAAHAGSLLAAVYAEHDAERGNTPPWFDQDAAEAAAAAAAAAADAAAAAEDAAAAAAAFDAATAAFDAAAAAAAEAAEAAAPVDPMIAAAPHRGALLFNAEFKTNAIDGEDFADGDEVVVLQARKYGNKHIFKVRPLSRWFTTNPPPRNPNTREVIVPADIERYRISHAAANADGAIAGGPYRPQGDPSACSTIMGGKRKRSKMNTKRKRRTSSHRRVRKGSYRTKKSTR